MSVQGAGLACARNSYAILVMTYWFVQGAGHACAHNSYAILVMTYWFVQGAGHACAHNSYRAIPHVVMAYVVMACVACRIDERL